MFFFRLASVDIDDPSFDIYNSVARSVDRYELQGAESSKIGGIVKYGGWGVGRDYRVHGRVCGTPRDGINEKNIGCCVR